MKNIIFRMITGILFYVLKFFRSVSLVLKKAVISKRGDYKVEGNLKVCRKVQMS